MIHKVFFATQSLVLMSAAALLAADIPVSDANLQRGLSPYNWVYKNGSVSSSVNGASLVVKFKGTRRVAVKVATEQFKTPVATRFPIIAWSINGGKMQTHQLAAGDKSVVLSEETADPLIELYIKGMSPFEGRFVGDLPANSVAISGFTVDDQGVTVLGKFPDKVWLNIGDSIMSGDGAAYSKRQGRPPADAWAASEDGRASYGYLLAKHFGHREGRLAYGGYNWGGGLAQLPALVKLIDHKTSTVSRLDGDLLSPNPDVVMINLGENGVPADALVIQALEKLRSRVTPATKILVMIPVSGKGRTEVSRAFNSYQSSAKDSNAFLVDLSPVKFDTCDGVHPTAAGHETIYQAALPVVDALVSGKKH